MYLDEIGERLLLRKRNKGNRLVDLTLKHGKFEVSVWSASGDIAEENIYQCYASVRYRTMDQAMKVFTDAVNTTKSVLTVLNAPEEAEY